MSRRDDWTTNLVECIVDLRELRQCEFTEIDALDFTTKVDKVRWIRGRRQRQRGQIDSHRDDFKLQQVLDDENALNDE